MVVEAGGRQGNERRWQSWAWEGALCLIIHVEEGRDLWFGLWEDEHVTNGFRSDAAWATSLVVGGRNGNSVVTVRPGMPEPASSSSVISWLTEGSGTGRCNM